jgi:hypothetical protein
MHNENLLRVRQALEIQASFEYVLTVQEIDQLKREGYGVTATITAAPWLYYATITKDITDGMVDRGTES